MSEPETCLGCARKVPDDETWKRDHAEACGDDCWCRAYCWTDGHCEPNPADIAARARAKAFEECARIAAMHVCRLAPLPCDGRAVASQECGCITSNRIADEIRRRAKP